MIRSSRIFIALLLCCFWLQTIYAETRKIDQLPAGTASSLGSLPNVDSGIVTYHKTSLNGTQFNYQATVGKLPIWDEHGKEVAGVFYTFYERTEIKDRASRPLIFIFNGGPGASSAILHLGSIGPRVVNLDEEGEPRQPYGTQENESSILDVADLVFVDPVETGYSRTISEPGPKDTPRWFSTIGDIKYLAEWIRIFLTRHNRWLAPKYLLGESFGTTRVAGLAWELQQHNIYVNGVILVAANGLDLNFNDAVSAALQLPFYTKLAWYKGLLTTDLQKRDVSVLLNEVNEFRCGKLIPAVIKGGFLDEREKREIAAAMALYSALPEEFISRENLVIDPNTTFFKEIIHQRDTATQGSDHRVNELPANAIQWALGLPGYAVSAWYHKLLVRKFEEKSMTAFYQEVENFTINEFIPAICREQTLTLNEQMRKDLVARIAGYTGLPENEIGQYDLLHVVRDSYFGMLNRKTGFEYGGNDDRYKVWFPDSEKFVSHWVGPPDGNAVNNAFAPAINDYLQNELKYKTDLEYYMHAPALPGWDYAGSHALADLRLAMVANPFMQVLFQGGYYDPDCYLLLQKYQMWQLDPSGGMRERIHFKAYASGHAVYLRKPERAAASRDLRAFIQEPLFGRERRPK